MFFCLEGLENLSRHFNFTQFNSIIFVIKDSPKEEKVGTNKVMETNSKDLAAVLRDGHEIRHMSEPSLELMKAAVKKTPAAIKHLKHPPLEVMVLAVTGGWNSLRFIEHPPYAVQLAAVRNKGWAIQYIKKQTEELQLEAVRRDYDAIQYIPNPSCAVQVAAVTTFWSALKYIENPCFEAKVLAVGKSEQAITYVGDYGEEELKSYLLANIRIVKYIYDSLDVQLLYAVLKEKFGQEGVEPHYIQDFMELQILDINKVNFIRDFGSRSTKQALVDYVLGR